MSRREKILVFVVAGLVGLFLLDWLVIQPTWSYLRNQSAENSELETQLAKANVLLDNDELIKQRWEQVLTAGLDKSEEALRSQVQQKLSVWSAEAGFDLTTLVSGRTVEGEDFHEVQFVVSGSGSLQSTVRLLEAIQRSPVPLRLVDLDLTSRDEKVDRVSLRAVISTVRFVADQQEKAGAI